MEHMNLVNEVSDRIDLLKIGYFQNDDKGINDWSLGSISQDEIVNMYNQKDISKLEAALDELQNVNYKMEKHRIKALEFCRNVFDDLYPDRGALSGNKTVKLTGKAVSNEMNQILSRLENGEYVSNDEIENTPEIALARSCINNSISTIKISGREELQVGIIEKMTKRGAAVIDENGKVHYNGIVKSESRLDIVIGLPASGKSSALVDVLSEEYHSRVIDNDEAKKMIPEFNKGWGSGVVHEESQLIELQLIKLAQDEGYTVNVHYVELSRNKALGRMIDRFIEEGSFLDPKLIDKYDNGIEGNKISNVYDILKKGGAVDGYSKWNNDVKRGERPILIETNCTGRFVRRGRATSNFDADKRDSRESRGGGLSGNLVFNGAQRGTQENGHSRNASDVEKGNVSGGVKKHRARI